MEIQFSTILTRCQDLSSYEGSRLKDAQGHSLYEAVAITEQDTTLIEVLGEQSEGVISKAIAYAISGYSYSEGKFKFVEKPNYTYKGSSSKDFLGAFVAYIMWQWLADKSTERSNVWQSIFETTIGEVKNGFRRNRPTLKTTPAVSPSEIVNTAPSTNVFVGNNSIYLNWLIESQNEKLDKGETTLTLSSNHDKELGNLCVSHHNGTLISLSDFGGVELGIEYDPSMLKGRLTTSALEAGMKISFKHPKYANNIVLSVVTPLLISVNYNNA